MSCLDHVRFLIKGANIFILAVTFIQTTGYGWNESSFFCSTWPAAWMLRTATRVSGSVWNLWTSWTRSEDGTLPSMRMYPAWGRRRGRKRRRRRRRRTRRLRWRKSRRRRGNVSFLRATPQGKSHELKDIRKKRKKENVLCHLQKWRKIMLTITFTFAKKIHLPSTCYWSCKIISSKIIIISHTLI